MVGAFAQSWCFPQSPSIRRFLQSSSVRERHPALLGRGLRGQLACVLTAAARRLSFPELGPIPRSPGRDAALCPGGLSWPAVTLVFPARRAAFAPRP